MQSNFTIYFQTQIKKEPFECPIDPKKARQASPPPLSPESVRHVKTGSNVFDAKTKTEMKEEDSEATDIEDESTDAGEFAFGMGLACVVCKQLDVTLGNQLIECQDCHSLYHQECHKPTVSDHEVSDPRHAWYCEKCKKQVKAPNKPPKMPVKSFQPASSSLNIKKDSTAQLLKLNTIKTEPKLPSASLQPFKRSEVKMSAPSSLATPINASTSMAPSKPGLSGLAGLAANLNKSSLVANSTNIAKTSSHASSTSTPTSSSTLMQNAADKRLQLMKKKALEKKTRIIKQLY